jgi:hypothetical protein
VIDHFLKKKIYIACNSQGYQIYFGFTSTSLVIKKRGLSNRFGAGSDKPNFVTRWLGQTPSEEDTTYLLNPGHIHTLTEVTKPTRRRKARLIPRPVDLLDDVYSLINRDLRKLRTLPDLKADQVSRIRTHGEFLVKAARELRQQELEEQKQVDAFMKQVIKNPTIRAHLKKLIEDIENGSVTDQDSESNGGG